MQQITEQISAKFLSMLPQDKDFVTPSQLLNHGFPGFLVKRIQVELEENFKNSIGLRKNEWIDEDNPSFSQALNTFLETVGPSLRMPLSYARSVIQKAIADVLLMLTEPRASLTDFLFGEYSRLTMEQVRERSSNMTVYKHFCNALPRFMEKKNYDQITKEQCSHFITALDEKLISRYSLENWEKLFEPWFVLMGAEINPDVFKNFFEDKSEKEIAARFGKETAPVTKTRLKQIITGKGLKDIPQTELQETQPKPIRLKEEISEETITKAVKDTEDYEENSILGKARRTYDHDVRSLSEQHERDMDIDEKFNALFSRFQKPDEDEGDDSESVPIWQRFTSDENDVNKEPQTSGYYEPEEEEEEEEEEEIEEPEIIEDFKPNIEEEAFNHPFAEVPETIDTEPVTDKKVVSNEHPPVKHNDTDADTSESDSHSRLFEYHGNDDNEKDYVPIIAQFGDDAQSEDPDSETRELNGALYNQLKDNKEYFVDNLFGGDEDEFFEVLEDLETCQKWNDAVRFLTENAFRRNFIDIYSEPAVDFTDILQDYFQKKT